MGRQRKLLFRLQKSGSQLDRELPESWVRISCCSSPCPLPRTGLNLESLRQLNSEFRVQGRGDKGLGFVGIKRLVALESAQWVRRKDHSVGS